jgi:hypothetical protein
MGVIIVDGRTCLQVKGSILQLERAVVGIRKLQDALGQDTLMIGTVPVPEVAGIVISIHFKGSEKEFEQVIVGLEDLKSRIAIDTVPIPEKLKIGSWPTPEKPKNTLQWLVSVRSKRS